MSCNVTWRGCWRWLFFFLSTILFFFNVYNVNNNHPHQFQFQVILVWQNIGTPAAPSPSGASINVLYNISVGEDVGALERKQRAAQVVGYLFYVSKCFWCFFLRRIGFFFLGRWILGWFCLFQNSDLFLGFQLIMCFYVFSVYLRWFVYVLICI